MESDVHGLIALICILLIAPSAAFGHGTGASSADVELNERLGETLPQDLVFYDENGTRVELDKFIDRPTIIAPVYFGCMHECPMLLTGLAQALGKMDLAAPGRDFKVVALSFDPTDTPKVSRDKKPNYLAAVGRPFPAEAWPFLVGDPANTKKFTDAIGYTIQKDGHDFSHPLALVVVAPGGKIVRYLYGVTFLPFDLTMAVTEAAEGRVGSTTRRVLMYCFSYDPREKSYVFNILKVAGTVTAFGVAGFFAYLVISTRKRRGAA